MPLPGSYVTRLKIIYAAVTKKIYGVESILTTTDTPEGKFEAFVSIGGMRSKYNEIPQKTAATIEADTIYHCLRYSTNVSGYKIVDLNYPILSQLLATMNRQSLDINILESSIFGITEYIDGLYDGVLHLGNEFSGIEDIEHLQNAMEKFADAIQSYYNIITRLCTQFMDLKVSKLSPLIFLPHL